MSVAAFPVHDLESVGLDELNTAASLLTRKDRKYLVPLDFAERLVSQDGLRALEIDGLRRFRYESVYFDTPDRVSYRAAAHKRRRRFKVRTRSYLDSGMCSLEVKTRKRRGLTEKHRLPYSVLRRRSLNEHALEFINGFGTIAPVSSELRLALTTGYNRTTLYDAGSMSRITVDTDLRWETPDGFTVSLPDVAIVETKTPGSPCPIDHFLWDAHRRPIKISKYCTGSSTPSDPQSGSIHRAAVRRAR